MHPDPPDNRESNNYPGSIGYHQIRASQGQSHDPVVTDAITGSNSYVIGQHLDDVALTESESEILFFLLRLPSLKGLSRVLNVSMHVVEREVESLMYKFGATSKRELLDVATQQGYLNQIPTTLFNQQLSVILREQG